ncbi:MAG: TIGR03790 family protein, partial [Steroidobacteraceae bacterium]
MRGHVLLVGLALFAAQATAESLGPDELGVIYNRNDASSTRIAQYYAVRRRIPASNLVGLAVPDRTNISRNELETLRTAMLQILPSNVQALLLVWSRP